MGVSVVLVTLGAVHIHEERGRGSYSAPRGYLRDVGEGRAASTWPGVVACQVWMLELRDTHLAYFQTCGFVLYLFGH